MSLPTLPDVKSFLRVTGDDLDVTLTLALGAAVAEAGNFIGGSLVDRWPDDLPSDVVMSLLLLVQHHVDAGSPQENEYRRSAAQSLLRPYRLEVGIA